MIASTKVPLLKIWFCLICFLYRVSAGPNDKIITPENFKDFFGPNGGTVTTDSQKAPSYNDTIGMTSFLYPKPGGTTNMSFIDVQMNVQTNAHNTTIFQEKFNHSSICMSMDNSSFSCWPMFRISRFPRFAGVKPGNHTIVATLIDPLTGGFIKNSTSVSKFKYKPINWTQWAIEQEERKKWEEEFEEVEVEVEDLDDEDEKKDPWKSRHNWFDRHKKKKKKKKIIRRKVKGGNATNDETNTAIKDEPVDSLTDEERGKKLATGNKFKRSNITYKTEEELFNTVEEVGEDDTSEATEEVDNEPMPIPLAAIDYPLENAWVNYTFEVQLQLITSANLTKFKKVFGNSYMCLSLDDATYTCWPIFEENYQPKFSNVKPGKHTLRAAISHPMTGEIIEGTGIGVRTFNVRPKYYYKRNNATQRMNNATTNAPKESLSRTRDNTIKLNEEEEYFRGMAPTASKYECDSCNACNTCASGPFFSKCNSCGPRSLGKMPNETNAGYEIYEEETVRVRRKTPISKQSSLKG